MHGIELIDVSECMNKIYFSNVFPLLLCILGMLALLQIYIFYISIPGKIAFIESKTLIVRETLTIVDTCRSNMFFCRIFKLVFCFSINVILYYAIMSVVM